jgi:hypothetical protein
MAMIGGAGRPEKKTLWSKGIAVRTEDAPFADNDDRSVNTERSSN